LASSASPMTSAPSRRRGTDHAGKVTCVDRHEPHNARRGLADRTPSSIRTSRSRANPQAESEPSQPGQHSRPAANSASHCSGCRVVDSTQARYFAHAQ
jgi:hypothetical protein